MFNDWKNRSLHGAIIRSGIQKVVIGTLDPNPNASGRGISLLEEGYFGNFWGARRTVPRS